MKYEWLSGFFLGIAVAAMLALVLLTAVTPTYLVTVNADGIPLKVQTAITRGDCLVALEKAYEQGPIPERLHCVEAK